ncbi:MAG: bifunctional diaminohydroxyphosphoribosylaminopyrimidine deaminase/5-amino-6-(5-phosphoribosylamino)uracil reductase RibD [Bacteroidetes bacterium]|nr:bifunctional diaminohydroxyphosphoribosylaminopyrimidine deaminase/5-amino-6-(5-phosphoribosylamino)uracil reductase RibD [Bacteroidota bacterium]
MTTDEQYMFRCLELAVKGLGRVAPNPMVGAVLVHDNRIIGEGWHQYYGGPHAEVNCIHDAIEKGNELLIPQSTLYVSLEPCAHQGKTPPCDQLIIRHKIPRVVIGCRDPFPEVNGNGIAHLQTAGIEVVEGVLELQSLKINKRFFCFHQKKRPYIFLKWAETADGFMGSGTKERMLISGAATNMLVHQIRSQEAAIMVGSNTVAMDNPQLTNRSGSGAQPVRVIIDRKLNLHRDYHVFDQTVKAIVLNEIRHHQEHHLQLYQLNPELPFIQSVCAALVALRLQSVLIEGGAKLLQLFIDANCWDEAVVIRNNQIYAHQGVRAPVLKNRLPVEQNTIGEDIVSYYTF